MKFEALSSINIKNLIKEYDIEDMCCYSITIGVDGCIYLFFIEGQYTIKYNYSLKHKYAAIRLIPDWYCGNDIVSEFLHLGEYREKFSSVHIFDNHLMLVGRDDKNSIGVVLDEHLKECKRMNFGIAYWHNVIVTDDNKIILGRELGEMCYEAVKIFDENGCVASIKQPSYWDVEAINLDEKGNLWYYAYPDYVFVCSDGRSVKCDGEIYKFVVLPYNQGLVASIHNEFKLLRFNGQTEKVIFTYAGVELQQDSCSFRQNRGVLLEKDMLYIFEM